MQSTTQLKLNGLKNQGATCYMNSLLQTLFMTPEFRHELYQYKSTQSEIQLADSIPYQLQRLFLNLQYSNDVCSTRKLIKSFQWQDSQKFEQHDAQEFCRVLFDAIQNSSQKPWIQKNYSGLMKSYVRCQNGHSSDRMQNFMDLSLTIKNPFENIQNHSLQQAIKNYLKPQKLQYGNKYMCQQCGQKVNAIKGLQFMNLPKILTIQLKRFELNYQTMQRQKINEFVYFPHILQMSKFLNEYDLIQINQIPEALQKMRNQPLTEQIKKKISNDKNQKIKFQKIPLKRKNSEQQIRNIEQVTSFIDDTYIGKQKKVILTQQEQKQKSIQILKNLKFNKDELDKKFQKISQQKDKQPEIKPVFDDFDNDILFGIGGAMIAQSTNWQQSKPAQKTSISYDQHQSMYNSQQQYPPNTYTLFAVLVHDGNAYHGHYYAYVKYGNQWFKFNDSVVNKVNQQQVRKYGDLYKFSQGANAYMLFYRDVTTIKQLKQVEASPTLLQNYINSIELEKQKKQQVKQNKKYVPYEARRFQRPFQIKLYYPLTNFTILQNIALSMTVKQLKQIIKQQFSIKQQDTNWRLRIFNAFQETLFDPIQDQTKTLGQNGLKQLVTLTLQFKQSHQIFQQYDPNKITLNIQVWKQGLLFQKQSQPIKINIKNIQKISTLLQKIKSQTNIKQPRIIKKSFARNNNVAQEISSNRDSTLIQLRLFNNLTLYVQNSQQQTHWQQEFNSQKYKVCVKFNNPKNQDFITVYYDNRKSLKDFKTHLGGLVNLSITQFKLKLSQDAPQLVGNKRLSDYRIIKEVQLFLQIGKSIKDIINISKCKAVNTQTGIGFQKDIEQQFQIEITKTVEDLKKQIGLKYHKNIQNIRIREFKRGFHTIIKNQIILSHIKDQSLVWEQIEDEFRGIQIYTRLLKDGVLEQYNQIYVQYDSSYQQLDLMIAQNYLIDTEATQAFSPSLKLQSISTIQQSKWLNINEQDGKISEAPFYIDTDGIYFIVRVGDKKQYKPKSKAMKQTFNYTPSAPSKQKSLVITVKKKQDKQKKLQQNSQAPVVIDEQKHKEENNQ